MRALELHVQNAINHRGVTRFSKILILIDRLTDIRALHQLPDIAY